MYVGLLEYTLGVRGYTWLYWVFVGILEYAGCSWVYLNILNMRTYTWMSWVYVDILVYHLPEPYSSRLIHTYILSLFPYILFSLSPA